MRRVLGAVALMTTVVLGADHPAHATGATAVSGVVVLSPGMYVQPNPLAFSSYQAATMTETQQGLFVAGFQAEVATLACTFNGSASESYIFGSAVFIGSCQGRGVTGVLVSKTCSRSYTRSVQYLVTTESCILHVGSSSAQVAVITEAVAHLPPPPTDRFYYTGSAAEVSY